MESSVEEKISMRRVKAYRPTVLKERREKINGRMMRTCSIIIEDLLFSNKNRVAVAEKLTQFSNLFKMLISMDEEHS